MTEPLPPGQDAAQARAELSLLHQETTTAMGRAQRREWKIAACVMVGMAALFGLGHLKPPGREAALGQELRWALEWAPLLLAALGMLLLARAHYQLLGHHRRLARIHRLLGSRHWWGGEDGFLSFHREGELLLLQDAVLIFGALFVSWYFGAKPGLPRLEFFLLGGWALLLYLGYWLKNRNEVAASGLDQPPPSS